jgi:hypothetical protein
MRRQFLVATVAVLVGAFAGQAWAEQQPHMRDALAALDRAVTSLEQASHDKGGHRAKALDLAKQARDEVKAGIAFDNTH